MTIRVRNVTGNSFQVSVYEWNYLNGLHNQAESVSFMVVEAGTHTLADGTVISAGSTNLTHNWQSVNFGTTFSSTPVVLSTVGTVNGSDAVVTRHNNTSTTGFDIRLQEEEAANQLHNSPETVYWFAIDAGTGTTDGGDPFEAGTTGANVGHTNFPISFTNSYSNPSFFAQAQSFNGGDPFAIRTTNVNNTSATIYLDEEKSKDNETNHNALEDVGYLVIGQGLFRSNNAGNPGVRFADETDLVAVDPAPILVAPGTTETVTESDRFSWQLARTTADGPVTGNDVSTELKSESLSGLMDIELNEAQVSVVDHTSNLQPVLAGFEFGRN